MSTIDELAVRGVSRMCRPGDAPGAYVRVGLCRTSDGVRRCGAVGTMFDANMRWILAGRRGCPVEAVDPFEIPMLDGIFQSDDWTAYEGVLDPLDEGTSRESRP